MEGIYNALKLSHLEKIILHTPWKNNPKGMEKCRERHPFLLLCIRRGGGCTYSYCRQKKKHGRNARASFGGE